MCSAKTKRLISCAVTAQLLNIFGFTYAGCRFSDQVAHLTLAISNGIWHFLSSITNNLIKLAQPFGPNIIVSLI